MRTRAIAIALTFLLVVSGAVIAAPAAHAATGAASTVFSLTNQQRAKAGLKPLISDAALDEAARAWAKHLADSCTFAHSSASWRDSRTSRSGWAATGENIAAGQSTPERVVAAWMASSGHRANILHPRYTGVGVGFAKGTCYSTYWVQIFAWSKSGAAPGAGDVNGDFDADVIAHNSAGQLIAYRGDGRGGWDGTNVVGSSWNASDDFITLGDFTGDGIGDIGRISRDGVFHLLPGTGTKGYGTAKQIGKGWSVYNTVVGGVDFNGDGKTDVLARRADGALVLYRGNGKGGWISGVIKVGSGWGSMTAIFYAGDFNGDGKGDVLARRSDGTLWMYPTTGKSGWGTPKKIGTGWRGMTAVFSPGDFDGSGKPDVLARRSDGVLVLYRGNGKGGWGSVSVVGHGWGSMRQIG
ncbi:FG-GAP-like repeat-containing protein [Microbacterium sulfonylureivorans]|uniref:FG-GAP-like repeat-containing protein n=1 Tax=Microbacterium sulfonylureivorans TaxID=2486854 RepID=UPI000FDC2AC1|nr:FG-GAP-like repeat-containing protein [Microbacterium sulfonylureivorans]